MVKTKFKKAVSLMLATVMSLTAFMGIGATTAFAAVGEKADVYLVDYPRSGDTNNNGEWGHGNLNYMNGWKGLSTKYTGLRAMGSYSGNIAYCIEPGTGQRTGDTLTEKDENFFNNINPNGTISGDDIRLLIGRILQYGYRGGISTSWKSQNESDANCIAHAYATQILIWETIVGERDASFNHVSTGGYNAVLECVSSAHPLRSKILSYYNSMVKSITEKPQEPTSHELPKDSAMILPAYMVFLFQSKDNQTNKRGDKNGLQSIDRSRAKIHLQPKSAALYADRSYRIFASRLRFCRKRVLDDLERFQKRPENR